MSVEIHESGEMYLKTILILLRKTGQVRSSSPIHFYESFKKAFGSTPSKMRDRLN